MIKYTVVRGDSLWDIADAKLGNGLRWTEIADLNNISRTNPVMSPGQVLKIDDGAPSTTITDSAMARPVIRYFGLQAGTERTMFAAWSWDRSNTANYRVMWYYYMSGIWFVGSDSNTKDGSDDYKNSTYSAPSEATQVKLKVMPISEEKKGANNTKTTYWTASWSNERTYDFKNNPPSGLSAPSVTIDKYTLTAELDNLDTTELNATDVQFQLVQDNEIGVCIGSSKIITGHASWSRTIALGSKYKVRCRAVREGSAGEWSDWSNNVNTIPSPPEKITSCKAKSVTSVYLEWTQVTTANTYDIEYTTKKEYFDGSNQTTTETNIEFTHYEITGLESGKEYFFRVRAVNEVGNSTWSEIQSVIVGTEPAAPTTWSSTTTAITGEGLYLYWVHNSEDGSSQTYAQLELIIGGVSETHTIKSPTEDEEKDKTSVYSINTAEYEEGTQILWKVRTAGVTGVYGEWSIQRTIDIYAPPTLSLVVTDSEGNPWLDTLTSFPFYVKGFAGPSTQSPIGYHLAVTSNEIYETVDSVGNSKIVNKGEEVYSKYYDANLLLTQTGYLSLLVELSANNIDLENNVSYTITCSVTMNSGLTATETASFKVAWEEEYFVPNAEIGIDNDVLAAYIRPYCEDEKGNLIEGVALSVYRREFDGSFTEIITGVDNSKNAYVTDPHPALDYARYRIIAMTNSTGAISYYDTPGVPVGEKAVIIQWNEAWSTFETDIEDSLEQPPWSGSLLRLPYNIDVSDKHSPDVSLINYIGKKHPISYYGTHLGETSTWNVEIPKYDKETLYSLNRLAIWMGDVYVREPSGSGYWANIKVSFSKKHCELTVPVTFDITRVEGGM